MGLHRAFVACALVACGALAGCPTVDLGDTPPDPGVCNPSGGIDYFTTMIWPNYLTVSGSKNCAQSSGCHLMAHGLALDPGPPVDYAAMYRLSQQYLNCGTPTASQLYTKPTNFDGHGGGQIFTASDPQATVFLNWFN